MGNIYFDKTNTSKSIYDFFASQQHEKKKVINVSFSYSGDFSSYISNFLKGIDCETDDMFDMLTNKNAKYFFY